MNVYKIIGLMSGTSLDGLDLAYCHIEQNNEQWQYEIVKTKSISYNEEMRLKLQNALQLAADELLTFNASYGNWLGEQCKVFIDEYGLQVDAISSHGHTVHHQPENGFTYQIGSGQHLANISGHRVICDFRTNDVALGGQGAPLVPIGDQLLFNHFDFCLNLGGISNISFNHQGKRIAYDIGLANMILNYIVQKIDLSYDNDGLMASRGVLNDEMLKRLNDLEYYELSFPKSTGYEWFIKEVVPIVETTDDTIENLLHTAVHHISDQIVHQLRRYSTIPKGKLFITGGGALNSFLMKTIQSKLDGTIKIVTSDKTLIEFKEALVFALMGVLRLEQKINVLSSVTGASKDSSSGVVYEPI